MTNSQRNGLPVLAPPFHALTLNFQSYLCSLYRQVKIRSFIAPSSIDLRNLWQNFDDDDDETASLLLLPH